MGTKLFLIKNDYLSSFFIPKLANQIEASNKIEIGIKVKNKDNTSGGVSIATTTTNVKYKYLRLFVRVVGLIIPVLINPKIKIGV